MLKIILTSLFITSTSIAALNAVDKAYFPEKNIMDNSGFENGQARWSASAGTFSIVTSGSNLLTGKNSATWDAAASSNTLSYNAITIPNGLKGKNAEAFCSVQTPSGTATHKIQVYDGTNVIAENDIVSNATPVKSGVNFIMPSSGTVTLRLEAQADEPLIAIDDCYLGEATNVGTVEQSEVYGTALHPAAASCQWLGTSATFADFSADADCTTPTVTGNASAPDTKIPAIKFARLEPGKYEVTTHFMANTGTSTTCAWSISDGTTNGNAQEIGEGTNDASHAFSHVFEYENAQSDITFSIQHDRTGGAGSCILENSVVDAQSVYLSVKRYPLSSEKVYRPDTTALSWSGYHDDDCELVATGTGSFIDHAGDASCTFTERSNNNFGSVVSASDGNNIGGLVFTPKRTGNFYICAFFNASYTSNTVKSFRLFDSTNSATVVEVTKRGQANTASVPNNFAACGVWNIPSIVSTTIKIQHYNDSGTSTLVGNTSAGTPAIEWSIFAIDQNFPMPQLTNTVVTSSPSVWAHESARINGAGGTPTVNTQSGNWIDSLTDNGTGDTTINFNTGIFSQAPHCVCSAYIAGNGLCTIANGTPISSSLVRVIIRSAATGSASDQDFFIMCNGPR